MSLLQSNTQYEKEVHSASLYMYTLPVVVLLGIVDSAHNITVKSSNPGLQLRRLLPLTNGVEKSSVDVLSQVTGLQRTTLLQEC